MASLCRCSAAARSAASRSVPLLRSPASMNKASPLFLRSVRPALVSLESLMPLHSAIASSRLKSFIAVDSSCWSWLSQARRRSRSRSRSFSPSSMKLCVGRGNSRPNPMERGGNSRSRGPFRIISQGVCRDTGPVRNNSPLSERESSTDNTSSSSWSRSRNISQGVIRDAGPVRKHSPLIKRESSTDNTSRSRSRSPHRSITHGVSRDAGHARKYSILSKKEFSTDNTSCRSRSQSNSQDVSIDAGSVCKQSSLSKRESSTDNTSRSRSRGYNSSVPARTQSPALLDQNLETFPRHHGNREETDDDISQKTLDGSVRTLFLSPENVEENEDLIQQTGLNHCGDDDVKEVGKGPVGTPLSCLDSDEEIEEGMISDD